MIKIANKKKETHPVMPPLAVAPKEAARLLGISERTLADILKNEQLPYKRLKRKILIPTQALRDFVSGIDGTDSVADAESNPINNITRS